MKRFLFCLFAIGIAESGPAQNLTQSLIQGAWAGQPAAVRGALASGRVNINVTTEQGDTPLMLASLAGHDMEIRSGRSPRQTRRRYRDLESDMSSRTRRTRRHLDASLAQLDRRGKWLPRVGFEPTAYGLTVVLR